MKKSFLFVLFTVLCSNLHSQISFESGYFIDTDNQKIDCLIKNMDWKYNPTEFAYKLQADSEIKKATIASVKEFGMHNGSRYVRHTVDMDRSVRLLNSLSSQRNPIFKEEQLFLQVLISGKASLYLYEDSNLQRFFYQEDNAPLKQLVYKKYKANDNLLGENNQFRQQLLNVFNCEGLSVAQMEKITYSKAPLVNYFVRQNACANSQIKNYVIKNKKGLFNLNLRAGLNSASLAIDNNSDRPSARDRRITDFGNEMGLRIGMEAEFIMAFNKNKWALIVEPTYQYYRTEKQLPEIHADLDYTSIDLPVGIRHYMFFNEKSKLYINASVVLVLKSDMTIIFEPNSKDLHGKSNPNLAFGLGYKHNDRSSLEFRVHTNQQVLANWGNWITDYNLMSVIFGYTLF